MVLLEGLGILKKKIHFIGTRPHDLQAYSIFLFLFYYLVCEAIGTAASPGLLFQPRVIMKTIVPQPTTLPSLRSPSRDLRDATIEELLEAGFSMLPVPTCYKQDKSRF
jgi:hypothetical protein